MNELTTCCLINVSGIGDIVSSLVLAQTLARQHCRITYVIREKFQGLLAGTEYRETYPDLIRGEGSEFDLLIDLTSSRRSRAICRQVTSPRKIGRYKNWRQWILYRHVYTRMVKKFQNDNIVRDYYRVAEVLGYACDPLPLLDGNAGKRPPEKKSLCIHIGASNEKRRIPMDLVVEIIAHAKASGVRVILLGNESDLARRIVERASGYPEYPSGDLSKLREWLAESDLVIAPDSGILHLAAAMGKPCLALYGPNTFSRSGPLSEKVVPIELDYRCRPCNQKKPCPHQLRCLNDIRFDAVRQAMDRLLSGASS